MQELRQSTAVTVPYGPFVDSTDGVTPETALTIQKAHVRLKKNGGDMAAASADQGSADAGAPHDEIGVYDGSLNTTDTGTLGRLRLDIQKSGAAPWFSDFLVITAAEWDAKYSTGLRDANVTKIGGDAQSMTDLKDFADTGYDPATHKVEGVKLADLITAYTGNTAQTGDSYARIGATGSGLTSLASATNLAAAKTVADAIKAVTDLLPNAGALSSLAQDSTVAKASALATAQTAITAIKAVTDLLPDLGALSSLAQDSTVAKAAALATAQTAITAIKAVTDALPNAGALTSLATAAALSTAQTDLTTLLARLTALRAGYLDNLSAGAVALDSTVAKAAALSTAQTDLTTIKGYLDTEIAAIISALALINTDTDDIQSRLPAALVGGRMDSNASAIGGVSAAAVRLALSAGVIIPGTVDTAGFAATTTQFEADDITTAAADHYNGRVIVFTSGSLIGQATSISDYSLATGRGHFTVPALTAAPADNVTFVIV